MGVKTKASFQTAHTDPAGAFLDNAQRLITPLKMRTVLQDIADSLPMQTTATGSANTYAIPNTKPDAYTSGEIFTVTIPATNNGASTLERNSLGVKDIKTIEGNALIANQLVAGGIYIMAYQGTYYAVLNPSPPGDILFVERTISSAEILAGNTSPVQLVAAPGAGKMIWPISLVSKLVYNTTPYATSTNWNLRLGTSVTTDLLLAGNPTLLSVGASNIDIRVGEQITLLSSDAENMPLFWYVLTADPTAGDSPLKVKLLYKIVTW